jgi:hypothetical protein
VTSEGNKVFMNDYCMTMTVECDVLVHKISVHIYVHLSVSASEFLDGCSVTLTVLRNIRTQSDVFMGRL